MTAARAEALLPVTEVAKLWRCSRDHVYREIIRGRLRTVQLGAGRAKTRIPESALAEYVRRNQRRPTTTLLGLLLAPLLLLAAVRSEPLGSRRDRPHNPEGWHTERKQGGGKRPPLRGNATPEGAL